MNASDIKVGDNLSRISYMKVIDKVFEFGVHAGYRVENENGYQWNIGLEVIDREQFNSASFFDKEEKLSLTEIVEKVRTAGHDVCTIYFSKQIQPKDIVKIFRTSDGKIRPIADVEKDAKKIKGEDRLMICRLTSIPDKFGRFQVIDLEVPLDKTKPYDNRIKQVDQATISFVILKGTKYTVRK